MKKSSQREGHLKLHSALVIGHKEKEGVQRVYSHPFAKKRKQDKRGHRQDLVFVRPPGQAIGGFKLSIDSVWYCKVLLFVFLREPYSFWHQAARVRLRFCPVGL